MSMWRRSPENGLNRGVPVNVNGFWENHSFHNYADYAMSAEFRSCLTRPGELGHTTRCAIMCSEAVWWRCHRRIIADYLLTQGVPVMHIMGLGKIDPAKLTPGARAQPDGTLVYPAAGEAAKPAN